jgi:hypothetical protein
LLEEVQGVEAELVEVSAWHGGARNGGEVRRPALGFGRARLREEEGEEMGGVLGFAASAARF